VGLTPPHHLVPKVLEKVRAIPVLTLRASVAYKKGEILPILTDMLCGPRCQNDTWFNTVREASDVLSLIMNFSAFGNSLCT